MERYTTEDGSALPDELFDDYWRYRRDFVLWSVTDIETLRAVLEHERARNLFEKGALPRQRLDAADTANRSAVAQRATGRCPCGAAAPRARRSGCRSRTARSRRGRMRRATGASSCPHMKPVGPM